MLDLNITILYLIYFVNIKRLFLICVYCPDTVHALLLYHQHMLIC